METEPKYLPENLCTKDWHDFIAYLEELKSLAPDLKAQDVLFIGEKQAQFQCDEYNISMYDRAEHIAKVFNFFL